MNTEGNTGIPNKNHDYASRTPVRSDHCWDLLD